MKVGVIGAGTMGQGIAKAFAQVDGYEVALCDIKQEWADGGKAKIQKGYARLVEKGKMAQEKADGILAKITPGLKEDLCADCDLIVEAAFENMEVKKTTFSELDKICKPECIFASNTSSLSITEIGNGLTRPMVGMHFFNPADRMKLIEVIAGVNTPAETVDAIKKISEEIGKTPVQVNEAAGFVVNRILIPMINEAAFIKMEGVSDVAGIDAAMKLGANHPPSDPQDGTRRQPWRKERKRLLYLQCRPHQNAGRRTVILFRICGCRTKLVPCGGAGRTRLSKII